jgi:hypothetical protein
MIEGVSVCYALLLVIGRLGIGGILFQHDCIAHIRMGPNLYHDEVIVFWAVGAFRDLVPILQNCEEHPRSWDKVRFQSYLVNDLNSGVVSCWRAAEYCPLS